MSAIAPAVGFDGPSNGYTALQAKLTRLKAAADALQERAQVVKDRMRRNAKASADLAEMCAAAEVDARHTAAIGEVSAAFGRVAGGGMRVASAAEAMGQAAGHLKAQHQAEYGGIHTAAAASRARQAKPGYYRQS